MYYILKYLYSFLLITNNPSANKILSKTQNKNIFFDHLIKYNKLKNNEKFKENIFDNYLINSFDKKNIFDYDIINYNINPKNIINDIDIYQNYKILLNNLNYNINNKINKYKFLENLLKNNVILNITNRFSPKTKVYIHIERILPIIPIYHVGITFTNFRRTIRYDVGQAHKIRVITPIVKITDRQTIFWGYSNKTMKEIINYEKSIKHKYILGINDCRHYTRNLATWTTNRPTPIWKIKSIMSKIN